MGASQSVECSEDWVMPSMPSASRWTEIRCPGTVTTHIGAPATTVDGVTSPPLSFMGIGDTTLPMACPDGTAMVANPLDPATKKQSKNVVSLGCYSPFTQKVTQIGPASKTPPNMLGKVVPMYLYPGAPAPFTAPHAAPTPASAPLASRRH